MEVRVVAVLRVMLLRWPGIMTSGGRPVKVICHVQRTASTHSARYRGVSLAHRPGHPSQSCHICRGVSPARSRLASSRSKTPMRCPWAVVTRTWGAFRRCIRSTSGARRPSGRTVAGPGSMASSIRRSTWSSIPGRRRRPTTMPSQSSTAQTSHPADVMRERTSSMASSSRQVGTSERAASATRRASPALPSVGRPAALQSAMPPT